MPKLERNENQTLEFKRQRTDRALEDLVAFANTEGTQKGPLGPYVNWCWND